MEAELGSEDTCIMLRRKSASSHHWHGIHIQNTSDTIPYASLISNNTDFKKLFRAYHNVSAEYTLVGILYIYNTCKLHNAQILPTVSTTPRMILF